METNYISNIANCIELVKQSVPVSLVYYSHIPTIITSIILALFLLIKSQYSTVGKLLFIVLVSFSMWMASDILLWTSYDSRVYMFFWSLLIIWELITYISSLFLIRYYIFKKNFSFKTNIFLFLISLPIIIVAGTNYNIVNFDIINCIPTDAVFYSWYVSPFHYLIIISIIMLGIKGLIIKNNNKKQIALMVIGILLFLISYASIENIVNYLIDNLHVESTKAYTYEMFGLAGLPIFIAFIAFIIVKFKAFNIKLIGAQALVWALVIFIGSQFLYMNQMPLSSLIITGITLILSAVIGLMIVRGIKKEIAIREKIEVLADQLENTNEKLRILDQQKTQFVSLASHQLRAPLTSIKGYLSMILEGDYGEVKGEAREMIERVEISANNLVTVVGDFLDVSLIEQGKMRYEWTDFDLKPLVETVYREQQPIAERKGLKLNLNIEEHMEYKLHGDMNKLKQVFTNLTDNSIKYTTKGEVNISLSRPSPKIIRFEIKDTGMGINAETLPRLFDKFVRAEGANDVNVIGTGLGLFVAKEMVKAHEGGKIWAESEGLGKGSRFVVELKAL